MWLFYQLSPLTRRRVRRLLVPRLPRHLLARRPRAGRPWWRATGRCRWSSHRQRWPDRPARPDPRLRHREGHPGADWHFFTETQESRAADDRDIGRRRARDRRHARAGRPRRADLRAAGHPHRRLPERDRRPLRRPVRIFVDAMSGLPSIVAGLFIYAVWVTSSGCSGFAASWRSRSPCCPPSPAPRRRCCGSCPTACARRPWRSARPSGARRGPWCCRPPDGLVTAVILGVARAVGETAPLIVTAFGSSLMNANPFHGPQDSLPLFVYKQITGARRPTSWPARGPGASC